MGELAASVTVEVPATIANLGAGFDCLGLAVELLLRVTIEARGEPGFRLEASGEGADELPADRRNRLLVALERGLLELRVGSPAGWRMQVSNAIPLERGLGASAAATVAGLVAAEALAGARLAPGRLLALASELEGHPDNAAPAIAGGIAVVHAGAGRLETIRLDPPAGLGVVVFVPDRRSSTAEMRALLPPTVPRSDAVDNAGRVALGVAALATGRLDLLGPLAGDRLHEPYRVAAYPELPELEAAARRAGALGAFLAGAGSTVGAFVGPGTNPDEVMRALAAAADHLGVDGRTMRLAIRSDGARVLPALVPGAA